MVSLVVTVCGAWPAKSLDVARLVWVGEFRVRWVFAWLKLLFVAADMVRLYEYYRFTISYSVGSSLPICANG